MHNPTSEEIDSALLYFAKKQAGQPFEGEASGFINTPPQHIKRPPVRNNVLEYFPQGPRGRTWYYGYISNERTWWVNHAPANNIAAERVTEAQFNQARVLYALQVLAEARVELDWKAS